MLIFILALVVALTALSKTGKEVKLKRGVFTLESLLLLSPFIVLLVSDLLFLMGFIGKPELPENGSFYLGLYFLVISYPLFKRISCRLNDAGKGRFWGYMALIPFINVFVYVYLSLLPSKSEAELYKN